MQKIKRVHSDIKPSDFIVNNEIIKNISFTPKVLRRF